MKHMQQWQECHFNWSDAQKLSLLLHLHPLTVSFEQWHNEWGNMSMLPAE